MKNCVEIQEEGFGDSDENALIGAANRAATIDPVRPSQPEWTADYPGFFTTRLYVTSL